MYKLKKNIIFLVLISLLSCNSTVKDEELFGLYIVSSTQGINLLELKSSGEYIHQYTSNSGSLSYKNKGSWKMFHNKQGEQRLEFSGFRFWDKKEGSPKTGFWIPIVEIYFGDIVLCFDPDISVSEGCFKKK